LLPLSTACIWQVTPATDVHHIFAFLHLILAVFIKIKALYIIYTVTVGDRSGDEDSESVASTEDTRSQVSQENTDSEREQSYYHADQTLVGFCDTPSLLYHNIHKYHS